MSRKGLSNNDKLELWRKYDGKCERCGLPIDKHKRGELHWGHIIAKSLGGSDGPDNRRPEHAACNLESAYHTEIPVAAKVKRVAKRDLGIREPSRWSKYYHELKERGWNPWTKKITP